MCANNTNNPDAIASGNKFVQVVNSVRSGIFYTAANQFKCYGGAQNPSLRQCIPYIITYPAQNGSSRKTADYGALNPYLARCAKCRGDVLHIANPSDRLSPRRQVELPVSRFDKKQTRCFCIGFAFYWSGLRGSNPPPPPWQGGALPNELNPHIQFAKRSWRPGWGSNPRPLA